MDLTSLKYWHWSVIGVVIGAAVGLSWMSMPVNERTGDDVEFRRLLGLMSPGEDAFTKNKGLPLIMNIVVMPPETDFDNKPVNEVTFERLGISRASGKPAYQSQKISAKTPFVGNESLIEFLNRRNIAFSDRTGPGAYVPVAYGAAIGLFAIGFLWPTIIGVLVGAGLEKPKPRQEKKTYATGKQNDGSIKDQKKGVNARDITDLNTLNDKLEASVGRGLTSGGRKSQAKEPDEIVSSLMSGHGSKNTQDPTAAVPQTNPEEPKEYQGEWYPVVKPKHHDQ